MMGGWTEDTSKMEEVSVFQKKNTSFLIRDNSGAGCGRLTGGRIVFTGQGGGKETGVPDGEKNINQDTRMGQSGGIAGPPSSVGDKKIVLESQTQPCREDSKNYVRDLDFIMWKTQKGKIWLEQ